MDDQLLSETLRVLKESTECASALQKEMAEALRLLRSRPTETLLLREQIAEAKIKGLISDQQKSCQIDFEESHLDALDRFSDRKIAPIERSISDLLIKIKDLTTRIDMTSKTLQNGEKTRETVGTIGDNVTENKKRIFGWISKESGLRTPGLLERIEHLESWLKEEEDRRHKIVDDSRERVKTFRFWLEITLKIAAIILPLGISVFALLSSRGLV